MNIKDKSEAKEYVLKTAKEQDVKFVRMWFTDILGFLKSFAITFEEIQQFANIVAALLWLILAPICGLMALRVFQREGGLNEY